MNNSGKLYILWTNDNVITSEKMVLMYALNSITNDWWKDVTVIIWGATAELAAKNPMIREKIKMAIHKGVKFSACKACADQLGVTDILLESGVEVKYWGSDFTDILKDGEQLITI